MRARHVALAAIAPALAALLVAAAVRRGEDTGGSGPGVLRAHRSAARTVAAYEGLGTWVDVYDTGAGTVTPDAVGAMARAGVRTLYLQGARDDGTGRRGLRDPALLSRWLAAAHREGLRVVGWYAPGFADIDLDLANLRAIASFDDRGHRFDGVAVDIERTDAVSDDADRSARLVELSRRLRSSLGPGAIGAIVPPPVHLEVVNPALWAGFPWRRIAPLYDVWLPMGYWTERTVASGYRDAARYTAENVARLRAHLGDDAAIHAIGGLGAGTSVADVDAFAGALADAGRHVIGASLYDWATVTPDARARMAVLAGR